MKKCTPSPDDDTTHPDPARRRVMWWTAAVFAFLALTVFALTPPSRAVFDEKVAELRAAGYATTLEESWRDAPAPEDNAAFEIEAAWNDLVEARGKPEKWGVTGPWDLALLEPWDESASHDRIAALAGALDEARPFLDRIEAAAARPAYRFREGIDAAGMPDDKGGRISQDVRKLLEAEAVASRDPRRRLSAAAAALRLARALGTDALHPGLYRDAGVRGVRRLVERGGLPAAEVRAACDALLRPGDPRWLQDCARDGVPWTALLVDLYLRGAVQLCMGTRTDPLSRSRIGRALREWTEGELRTCGNPSIEECAAALECDRRVAELPPSDLQPLLRAVDAIVAELPRSELTETWPRILRVHARREAACALARVALAAAEFHEREGRWPESLDALAPMFPEGVSVDPCDGMPFEVVVADGKYRLAARGRFPDAKADPDRTARDDLLVWEFVDR